MKQCQSGLSLVELSAALAITLIVATIALPRVLCVHGGSSISRCDVLFVALDGEIANALDSLVTPADSIVRQVPASGAPLRSIRIGFD